VNDGKEGMEEKERRDNKGERERICNRCTGQE